MKGYLLIGCYFLGGWLIAHSLYVTIDGLSDTLQKADCVLILGNKVNEDGTLSDRLRSRVEKGMEVYRLGMASKIIVSGGLGKEGYYEGTEMKKYLLQQGVPESAIIVDNAGNTTLATALNFRDIASTYHLKSVIVVSQFYHLTRTKLILAKTGRYELYTAHATYFEARDVFSLLREFPAFYQYLFF